jgi:hypothetical protein
MGSYGSQSGDRIAAANAYDKMVRRERQAEPKLLVALPKSLVEQWAAVSMPLPMTLDHKHDLVLACKDVIGESNVN